MLEAAPKSCALKSEQQICWQKLYIADSKKHTEPFSCQSLHTSRGKQ